METLPALPVTQAFDVIKFSQEKATLQELATKYSALTINGVEDVAGYEIADAARKDLKKNRVIIQNDGKAFRQRAVDFQKNVIKLEKELIGIIEPLELELKAKQDVVDEQKRKALRLAALPARQEKLAKISFTMTDDEILAMSAEEFVEFYNVKYGDFLEATEKRLKDAEAKLAREKELADAKEVARIEAMEQAAKDVVRIAAETKAREEQAAKDAEEAQKRAVKEAQDQAETEKRKIIADQKKIEDDRLAKIAQEKFEADAKVEQERLAAAKLQQQKKYQDFLLANGYSEGTKADFYVEKTPTQIHLYKRLSTFDL